MTKPPAPQDAPRILHVAGIALLVPHASTAPIAVALSEPHAPGFIRAELDVHPASFTRLRRGSLAYGLLETYVEVDDNAHDSREEHGIVSPQTHYEARLEHSAELFGSPDTVAFIPRPPAGEEFDQISIPVPAPGHPSRVLYRMGAAAGANHHYLLAGVVEDEVWICPVCARPCVTQELHTAAHGVPGNLFASTANPHLLDEVHGRPGRIDDPGYIAPEDRLSAGSSRV
jgi:hypothetical protein